MPTDYGPMDCPDCGGAGVLPPKTVLIEWRAGEIERQHGVAEDQLGQDVRWLVFELRRARAALTKLNALIEDMGEDEGKQQMRFIANDALGLYAVSAPPEPPQTDERSAEST